MPRNGSGVYSKPAGTTAISGQVISSTYYNTLMDDFADEITGSLPTDGTAPMTGVLRVANGAVGAPSVAFANSTTTGVYRTSTEGVGIAVGGLAVSAFESAGFSPGAWADLASATTTDLGSIATGNIRVTGTTTITSLGSSAASGTVKTVRFAAALTLTYNGTSLILPGAGNITTAANDTAVFVSLGSGNWICTSYQRAATDPSVGMVLLSSGTASSAATLDLTVPTSTYKAYRLIVTNMTPATNAAVLAFRISLDNGATYKSGGSDYIYSYLASNPSGSGTSGGTTNSVVVGGTWSNTALTSIVTFDFSPGSATYAPAVYYNMTYMSGVSLLTSVNGGGIYVAPGPLTNVRLLFSSGNIANAEYRLYGMI